jgi:hypothetical protein
MGYCAASSRIYDDVLGQPVCPIFKTLEYGTDRLSGNVGKKLPLVQISFPRDATLSSLYFISYRITLHASGALCAHYQEF